MLSSAIAPVTIARSQNISPFNLVHLARRGCFQAQRIPSYSALCAAVMKAAIHSTSTRCCFGTNVATQIPEKAMNSIMLTMGILISSQDFDILARFRKIFTSNFPKV